MPCRKYQNAMVDHATPVLSIIAGHMGVAIISRVIAETKKRATRILPLCRTKWADPQRIVVTRRRIDGVGGRTTLV